MISSPAAFKEWASIVKALALGEQIIILRKGGIHETGRQFRVSHESFLLFPTYEHQNPEDLNERGRELLQEILTAPPSPDSLTLEYFANVEKSFLIQNLDELLQFSPYHVWSEAAVRKRYEWGKEKGLTVIVCRVYQLAQKQTLKMLPAYGGCRSWVNLEMDFSREAGRPVLTDGEFEEKLKGLAALS